MFLLSDRVVQVLKESGLSGWVGLRAEARGNPSLPVLFLLQVTGRCGPIFVGVNGIGQYLDPETIDGSDFFVPANEARVFLSPRAGEILSAASLRNVEVRLAGLESLDG